MRRHWKGAAAVIAALALTVALAGCATTEPDTPEEATTVPTAPKGQIRVGSKIDVEGPLLGHMIIAMLEKEGFTVEDRTRTGATDVVRKALIAGQIDIYPEYTANGVLLFLKDQDIDPTVLRDAQRTYDMVKRLDLQENDVVWLKQAPANNTWAVAVKKDFAEANDLSSMSDWAAYVNSGKPVKIVGSQEFFTSEAAMPAFEKAYGFKLKKGQTIALATGDTAVTERAVAEGTNDANAAMAYGTDGTIAALGLVVLSDPRAAQPVYQPAPTVRKEIMDAYPEIAGVLDPVFEKLTLETLQELNGRIAVEGKNARTVAREWLESEGLLE